MENFLAPWGENSTEKVQISLKPPELPQLAHRPALYGLCCTISNGIRQVNPKGRDSLITVEHPKPRKGQSVGSDSYITRTARK